MYRTAGHVSPSAAPEHPLKRITEGFLAPPRWGVMGLAENTGQFLASFAFLGFGIVIAVVVYDWTRGSGIPIIGKQAPNGAADAFNGGY